MPSAATLFFHAFDPAEPVPAWIHLLPAGTFSGADGRGPFVAENVDALIRNSLAGGKLAVDENHAIDLSKDSGAPSPARGWIVEMEARADGVWGRVEWTASGRALLDDHAYRGISPVFMASKSKPMRVERLLRAALTNDPNLSLTSLHGRSAPTEPRMDPEELRKLLGLPEGTTDEALLNAVRTLTDERQAHAAGLQAVATAAGLAATADAGAIATHLNAARTKPDEAGQLRQTVISLQTQLNSLQAENSRREAERVVDQAIKDGKPIAALRDHYVERHMTDAAGVRKELDAMVSLHSGGFGQRRPAPSADGATLSAEEERVAELMGLDPKKMAETAKTIERGAN